MGKVDGHQNIKIGAAPNLLIDNMKLFTNEDLKDILLEVLGCGILRAGTITYTGGLGIEWDNQYELYRCEPAGVINAIAGSDTCTDNMVNYLNFISGTGLTLSTTPADLLSHQIQLAQLSCQSGAIHATHEEPIYKTRISAIISALEAMFANVVVSGLTVEPDTDATSLLDVKLNSGVYFKDAHARIDVADILTRVTPMARHWQSTPGNWTYDLNASVAPLFWESSGVATGTTAAKYYKSIFIVDGGVLHWRIPTAEYNNPAAAIAGPDPDLPPGLSNLVKVTALVLKGDATTLPIVGADEWIDRRPGFSLT